MSIYSTLVSEFASKARHLWNCDTSSKKFWIPRSQASKPHVKRLPAVAGGCGQRGRDRSLAVGKVPLIGGRNKTPVRHVLTNLEKNRWVKHDKNYVKLKDLQFLNIFEVFNANALQLRSPQRCFGSGGSEPAQRWAAHGPDVASQATRRGPLWPIKIY